MSAHFLRVASAWLRGRREAAVVFVAVLAVATVVLTQSHRAVALRLPRAQAIAAVRRSHEGALALRGVRRKRVDVLAVDSTVEQVNFYTGSRLVVEAAVRSTGTVEQVVDVAHRPVPYGNAFAYRIPVLLGLLAVFVLMAGVMPLRRLRNLDVAAMAALSVPLILIQHGYVDASMIVAALPLVYLAIRCGRLGLAPRDDGVSSSSLFEVLAGRLSERERTRILRALALAAGLTFLMVGVSSPGPVDVIYAVMEGATKIVHGVLPYGHLPGDVIHGDTYPVLSYALFAPVALLQPVTSMWDSVDCALAVTVLAALAAAACRFWMAAGAVAERDPRSYVSERAGLRAAITLLCFPPMLVVVSTGTTDVVMGALLMLAVILWKRPGASSSILAVAGWFKLAPFALVPLWLAPQRGAKLVRALGGLVIVSAVCIGLVVFIGGSGGLTDMARSISYQFSRGAFQSVWHAAGIESLQPVAEATVLAFIAAAFVHLRYRSIVPPDPQRMAALAAAVLIGLQLAANYWAFLYLAWIGPVIMASLLAEPAAKREHAFVESAPQTVPLLVGMKLRGAG